MIKEGTLEQHKEKGGKQKYGKYNRLCSIF